MSARVQGWVWELDLPAQPKMVRYHLRWLAADRNDQGCRQEPFLRIVERRVAADRNTSNVYVLCVPWARQAVVRAELDELKHVPGDALMGVGATGGTQGGGGNALHPVGATGRTQVGDTGCTQNRSPVDSQRNSPPIPPEGPQPQQGQLIGQQMLDHGTAPTPASEHDDRAQTLAIAFYRGLGADAEGVTAAIRRRDTAIARQLVAAGATPAEAESYARETSAASGRIAPVDLRSFERERLGWLARRRGRDLSQRQVVDRTGQPPSWQTERRAIIEGKQTSGVLEPPVRPKSETTAGVANTHGLAGDQLGEKLRTLLRGGGGGR